MPMTFHCDGSYVTVQSMSPDGVVALYVQDGEHEGAAAQDPVNLTPEQAEHIAAKLFHSAAVARWVRGERLPTFGPAGLKAAAQRFEDALHRVSMGTGV